MATDNYFAINNKVLGVDLPQVAKNGATFSVQDVDSSETGRNQNGDMIRERLTTKIKWQLTFPPLSRGELSALLNAVSGVTINFTYPDPFSPTDVVTKTCYVGDRTAPMYTLVNGLPMWQSVSFSVIEM